MAQGRSGLPPREPERRRRVEEAANACGTSGSRRGTPTGRKSRTSLGQRVVLVLLPRCGHCRRCQTRRPASGGGRHHLPRGRDCRGRRSPRASKQGPSTRTTSRQPRSLHGLARRGHGSQPGPFGCAPPDIGPRGVGSAATAHESRGGDDRWAGCGARGRRAPRGTQRCAAMPVLADIGMRSMIASRSPMPRARRGGSPMCGLSGLGGLARADRRVTRRAIGSGQVGAQVGGRTCHDGAAAQ